MPGCRLAGTAMGRRSRGFVRRGGLEKWCTAARCCRRRCRPRRRSTGCVQRCLMRRCMFSALSAGGSAAQPLIVGGDGALANRLGLDHVASVSAVVARLDEGAAVPGWIVFDHLSEVDGSLVAAAHAAAARGLVELQGILGEARLNDTAVAWLTSGAVSTGPDEGVCGLSRA